MPSTSSAPDAARSLTGSTRDAAAVCTVTAAPGDAGRRGLRAPPGGADGGGGLSTIWMGKKKAKPLLSRLKTSASKSRSRGLLPEAGAGGTLLLAASGAVPG
jgi:hypothetical protein